MLPVSQLASWGSWLYPALDDAQAARRMLAIASNFGFMRRFFTVFAAVLAVCGVCRDDTVAGRMRALVRIRHLRSPTFSPGFPFWPSRSALVIHQTSSGWAGYPISDGLPIMVASFRAARAICP